MTFKSDRDKVVEDWHRAVQELRDEVERYATEARESAREAGKLLREKEELKAQRTVVLELLDNTPDVMLDTLPQMIRAVYKMCLCAWSEHQEGLHTTFVLEQVNRRCPKHGDKGEENAP